MVQGQALINEAVQKQQILRKKHNQTTLNFSQIGSFKSHNVSSLLPGLEKRSKSFLKKKQNKKHTQRKKSVLTNQQSNLLRTALTSINKKRQSVQTLNLALQDNISGYFASKNITPINPLLGNNLTQNTSMVSNRKRLITHQTNKSRLQSIASQLFDINSQTESNHQIIPVHKRKEFMLQDVLLGQSDAVFEHVFKKKRKINPKLVNLWKYCLSHEDKTQIYIPINPEQRVNIPYTHPREFPLDELEKGFQQVYGQGKNRSLKIGQEASIIQEIEKYLRQCDVQPMKITRKDYDILSQVLQNAKLSQLQSYPMCLKQAQSHLKIMATRWKYKNMYRKDKKVESAIINGKNNFIDLGKSGVLTNFLLKNSNKNEMI